MVDQDWSGRVITGYTVVAEETSAAVAERAEATPRQRVDENLKRPDSLTGVTYKIKPVASEPALYLTINDVVLDAGTPFAHKRPFEMFINAKSMDQFQWVVALTRLASAVFRKGGDVTFLADELKNIFDPRGGHFSPGRGYVPSLVAEIGLALETHLRGLGLLPEAAGHGHGHGQGAVAAVEAAPAPDSSAGGWGEAARWCSKCNTKSVVVNDGCATCMNCGDSKCG